MKKHFRVEVLGPDEWVPALIYEGQEEADVRIRYPAIHVVPVSDIAKRWMELSGRPEGEAQRRLLAPNANPSLSWTSDGLIAVRFTTFGNPSFEIALGFILGMVAIYTGAMEGFEAHGGFESPVH